MGMLTRRTVTSVGPSVCCSHRSYRDVGLGATSIRLPARRIWTSFTSSLYTTRMKVSNMTSEQHFNVIISPEFIGGAGRAEREGFL